MKQIIVFFIFLCTSFSLSSQILHSQDDDEFRLFDAGIIAGGNFSQIDGDYLAGFNKLGLNAGGIAQINFNEIWSIGIELLYAQKGSRTRPDPDQISTYKLVLNYVEIPVSVNFKDQNRMIFSGGLIYGRLFKYREFVNGYETVFTTDLLEQGELSYHLSGTFLIGDAKHFGVNFRYQQSLTIIGPSLNSKVKGLTNRLLSLRGVYYF